MNINDADAFIVYKTDENGEYNMNMSNISRSISLKRAKKKNFSNEDLNMYNYICFLEFDRF